MRKAFAVTLAAISLAVFSSVASAESIDHALAGNPDAIMAQVDAMHLTPLSDANAAQVRGEFLPLASVFYYAVVYGIPLTVQAASWASFSFKPGVSYYSLIMEAFRYHKNG